jgi:hypothetical protein
MIFVTVLCNNMLSWVNLLQTDRKPIDAPTRLSRHVLHPTASGALGSLPQPLIARSSFELLDHPPFFERLLQTLAFLS